MKYTRMLCWVTTETKSKILEISEDLPIIFTDNYKSFREKISKDSYLAVGLSIAYENLDKISLLLQDFPNKIQIIHDVRGDSDKFN